MVYFIWWFITGGIVWVYYIIYDLFVVYFIWWFITGGIVWVYYIIYDLFVVYFIWWFITGGMYGYIYMTCLWCFFIIMVVYCTASDAEATPHDCCWKAFHTDVNGRWYKPHKAGPVMAGLLVVGWILFLVFFGWVVGLALLLVLLLTLCACFVNFLCTGKCQVEDDSEEQQQQTEGQAIQGNQTRTPQNYGGAEGGTVGGAMGGH